MERDIRLHRWTDLDAKITGIEGRLTYDDPHTGRSAEFEYATWTSPTISPGFAASQLIPSWTARTPAGAWIQIELRFTTGEGTTSGWYVLGRWAEDSSSIRRTSVPDQKDVHGRVNEDTLTCADGHEAGAWQVRVRLFRPAGSDVSPQLGAVSVMASRLPVGPVPASKPRLALGRTLPVPQYSQHVHAGQNPEWSGGGRAWCSPTSVSMAAAYWGCGPDSADYAWVTNSDPWVNEAAGRTYDHAYGGCGNWPFNTAYAGRLGLDSFVTRLRSLTEVETFIAAGIPLVLSASFRSGQIPGADYDTDGHLLMVVGFTATGDPVMNDPAAPDNRGVRKVFGRAEFESAWLNSSGGLVYVIRPHHRTLPAAPAQANW